MLTNLFLVRNPFHHLLGAYTAARDQSRNVWLDHAVVPFRTGRPLGTALPGPVCLMTDIGPLGWPLAISVLLGLARTAPASGLGTSTEAN